MCPLLTHDPSNSDTHQVGEILQETQMVTDRSPVFNEHFCCKLDFLAN